MDAFVGLLRNYAGPTGARGSVLLMSGGLVVLGFLFTVFIFRSAVVGDMAPAANRRGPAPAALMPPERPPPVRFASLEADGFAAGRQLGRKAPADLDGALGAMPGHGLGAPRILQAGSQWMRVRVYASGDARCDVVRGYLAGALERLVGPPAKVDETCCRSRGAEHCEFVIRHPRREVKH